MLSRRSSFKKVNDQAQNDIKTFEYTPKAMQDYSPSIKLGLLGVLKLASALLSLALQIDQANIC